MTMPVGSYCQRCRMQVSDYLTHVDLHHPSPERLYELRRKAELLRDHEPWCALLCGEDGCIHCTCRYVACPRAECRNPARVGEVCEAHKETEPAAPLTNDQRLTLLSWALRSVLIANGEPFTLWDRLLEMGVRVDELLADAPPLSSPPYSRDEFERLVNWRCDPSLERGSA